MSAVACAAAHAVKRKGSLSEKQRQQRRNERLLPALVLPLRPPFTVSAARVLEVLADRGARRSRGEKEKGRRGKKGRKEGSQ